MRNARRWFAVLVAAPVIALAGCGGGTPAGSAPTPQGEHVPVALTDFQIAPTQVAVHQEAVVFDVSNRGQSPHNLGLRNGAGAVVGHTRDLDPGQSATLALRLDPGTYTTFCSLAGHESLGMHGTVTVGG